VSGSSTFPTTYVSGWVRGTTVIAAMHDAQCAMKCGGGGGGGDGAGAHQYCTQQFVEHFTLDEATKTPYALMVAHRLPYLPAGVDEYNPEVRTCVRTFGMCGFPHCVLLSCRFSLTGEGCGTPHCLDSCVRQGCSYPRLASRAERAARCSAESKAVVVVGGRTHGSCVACGARGGACAHLFAYECVAWQLRALKRKAAQLQHTTDVAREATSRYTRQLRGKIDAATKLHEDAERLGIDIQEYWTVDPRVRWSGTCACRVSAACRTVSSVSADFVAD